MYGFVSDVESLQKYLVALLTSGRPCFPSTVEWNYSCQDEVAVVWSFCLVYCIYLFGGCISSESLTPPNCRDCHNLVWSFTVALHLSATLSKSLGLRFITEFCGCHSRIGFRRSRLTIGKQTNCKTRLELCQWNYNRGVGSYMCNRWLCFNWYKQRGNFALR